MRARGDSATEILTAETMADKYGVQKGSYDTVPLPTDVDVQQARHALTTPNRALHWHCEGRHRLSVISTWCMGVFQQVTCTEGGPPADVLHLVPGRLPQTLEWQEVLVHIQAAPINPADVSLHAGCVSPGNQLVRWHLYIDAGSMETMATCTIQSSTHVIHHSPAMQIYTAKMGGIYGG